jgi:hypothetical protein
MSDDALSTESSSSLVVTPAPTTRTGKSYAKNIWGVNGFVKNSTGEPAFNLPHGKVPVETMIGFLEEWKRKIEGEMAVEEARKEKVAVRYRRQRDLYDSWLAGPLREMKKHDKIINYHKKSIMDIDREIDNRRTAAAQAPQPIETVKKSGTELDLKTDA